MEGNVPDTDGSPASTNNVMEVLYDLVVGSDGNGGLTANQLAALIAAGGNPITDALDSRYGNVAPPTPTDGPLALASSSYKSKMLAAGTSRVKFIEFGDSTNDGFGGPNGVSSWAMTWPQILTRKLRANLGLPAGGRGWVPPSPPVGPASYSYTNAQLLPVGAALDEVNWQVGIPGSLWLQRGAAGKVDQAIYPLSANTSMVQVIVSNASGPIEFVCGNAEASVTQEAPGFANVVVLQNPGSSVSIRPAEGQGVGLLGIIEFVSGDDAAGITSVNLSQASIRTFEFAGWLADDGKHTLTLTNMHQPDVALVCSGPNDFSTGRTPAQMSEAMTTVYNKIKQVAAQCEVIFIVRPNPETGWDSYAENILTTANNLGARSLDLRGTIQTRNSYVDEFAHFNDKGSEEFAELVFQYMKVAV